LKVLVVDDDRTMRSLLRQLLTRLLFREVIEAEDGLEGLGAIQNDAPDLVLLDTLMPVMDGIAMLETVRSTPLYANIPVISVSSVTHRSLIVKLISLGILDYISKPLDLGDAKQRLETVIRSIDSVTAEQRDGAFPSESRRENLLLIEKNPEFRGRARPVLERHFVVSEASSCMEGLYWIRARRPDVVCVADGQVSRDERMFADAIRSLPRERPAVYLLTERPWVAEEDRQRYDGLVAKSLVPDLLFREVRRLRASARAALILEERFESAVHA